MGEDIPPPTSKCRDRVTKLFTLRACGLNQFSPHKILFAISFFFLLLYDFFMCVLVFLVCDFIRLMYFYSLRIKFSLWETFFLFVCLLVRFMAVLNFSTKHFLLVNFLHPINSVSKVLKRKLNEIMKVLIKLCHTVYTSI